MKIRYLNDIGGHEKLLHAVNRAKVELDEKGWGNNWSYTPVGTEAAYIAEHEDGHILGFIIFYKDENTNSTFISLSWTDPAHRCQGIHKQLYGKLEELARKQGRYRIYSGINPANTPMIETAKRLGRVATTVFYTHTL